MELTELFAEEGTGVLSTAGPDGIVNTAIYSRPHIVDHETLAWGMTDSRTYRNISCNPNASYLFIVSGRGFHGIRLGLVVKEIQDSGEMLDTIRQGTEAVVGKAAASAVKHAVFFRITETRPLV